MARTMGAVLFTMLVLPLLASAASTAGGASAVQQEGSKSIAAVQKVIQMLSDMTAKGKLEKKDEEVAFAKFKTWCSQESASLKTDIKKGGEEIETLSAEIAKLGTDITGLGEEIAELQEKKASDEADLKAHKGQRAKDHEDFLATEADFSESVDALERAIAILSKENYDRPAAAAALLQLSSGTAAQMMPQKAQSIMRAFMGLLQQGKDPPGGMEYEAPEANAYEFQSSGVIDMLKKLQDEFREKLGTAQKEEKNSQHAHDMIVMDLTDAIQNGAKTADEKTKEKERKVGEKAANEKRLEATKATKASDEQTLKEVTTECEQKTLSFKEKQQLRTEELEAIAKAIEILKSPDVLGSAEKHLDFAQVSSASSLLQGGGSLRAVAERSQGVHRRVREFLESEGRRLKSKHIALLADKMLADPFAKVKQLIDSMITRLLEEAKEDADHEGFCDTEMGKSKITRNKLNEDIDALTAAVDEGKAQILELTESTEHLSKEVKDLIEAMTEATQLRKDEKATNKETVQDAKAAQTAVAAATAVLKDFYEKAGTATGFLQLGSSTGRAPSPRQWGLKMGVKMGTEEWNALANPNFEGTVDKGHKEGMQTFGEVEKGQQDEAEYGVLGLLEVIMSDFAKLEADTTAAEAAAQKAYERFMVESKKSKATKDRKIEMNNADRAEAEAKLQEDTADLKTTQDELLAAERYYKKLVPQCIDQGMTWEERVAARQAEIDSLKEALKILNSPDVA